MSQLELLAKNLETAYGSHKILHGINVQLPPGKITAIIGANACGKSTLLKTMARILTPSGGAVELDGRKLSEIPTKELATKLGLLPQHPLAPEGITVADLVSRGRSPHQKLFSSFSNADATQVAFALEATGISELANRAVDELSGGQRQRVWIAMALAQDTGILLLDEPTTYLDLNHQVEVLDLLVEINHLKGTTVAMVLHDVNLAARYADYLIAMKAGNIVAAGEPQQIMNAQLMQEIMGLKCQVITDPVAQTPLVVPIGKHRTKLQINPAVTTLGAGESR